MSYRYYQVLNFRLHVSDEDSVRQMLNSLNCIGLEISSPNDGWIDVRTYFEEREKVEIAKKTLYEKFKTIKELKDTEIGLPFDRGKDQRFEPYPFLLDLWVYPFGKTDSKIENQREKIFLKPGMAFGSGRHETTQLVGQLLWDLDFKPRSLLDVGTGSGILALLAKKKGIAKVDTVEISTEARENANENFRINGFEDILIFERLNQVDNRYEVVLANLLTETLIQIKKELLNCMAPSSVLILSGITKNEERGILDRFGKQRLIQKAERGEWVGLALSFKGFKTSS